MNLERAGHRMCSPALTATENHKNYEEKFY